MKKTFTPPLIFLIAAMIYLPAGVNAQCGVGYTASELNWDNIDFLPSDNPRYTSFYPVATATIFPFTQNFTIGTRKVNFAMAPNDGTSLVLNGENGSNTAHAGTPVTAGDDVQFTTGVTTNCTITLTFDADVANVQFSLFDLDNSQRVAFTATNGGSVAQSITLARAAGTAITLGGTATNPIATGPAGGLAGTDNTGSLNVTIAGPVRQIIITLSNAAGNIWLSDIDACVTGTFPNAYHMISRPFIGQNQYVLTVVNNNIYYTDTAGRAYFLFNEPGHTRLNSMAYDPYERIVYYTYSLTGGSNPQNDKTLKKYDVDTKTISVVIPDVNTFGIPTYESGVESGAATFYNGSLYLGIEGYTGTSGGGAYAASRKSTIWRIDFDAAGNAVPPAAQVWGVTADDGSNSQNIHDWSDFGITNGILTDFDGSQSGDIDYYQTNLFTGVTTNYIPTGPIPRQVSIGYDEKLYNVDATIALYNGTNGVVGGTTYTIFSPLGPTIPTGSAASWGDAAGPYRPFLDFGDAPATYDPNTWSPACHDTLTPTVGGRRTKLILGPNEDVEWLKKGLTTVEDTYEDGLAFVPIFSPVTGSYQAQVTLLNNTGATARLCAWLDFNGNGYFDPSESITPITVPSAIGVQSFWLTWPSLSSSLPSGSFTHLRIRLTSSPMTANNSTGYYNTGEVEDYRVVVDNSVLSVQMMSFDANVLNDSKINLSWQANEEVNLASYDIERSVNGSEWEHIANIPASQTAGAKNYQLVDDNPYIGKSLYRLKLIEISGRHKYSNIQTIEIKDLPSNMTLYPNPVIDKATLTITGARAGRETEIYMMDANGNVLSRQKIILSAGINAVRLAVDPAWPSGVYVVRIIAEGKVEFRKFILRR
jgi:hypothetical protein